MAGGSIAEIISAVVVILAIFGIIYMLKDPLIGIILVGLCGVLIFINAFIKKNS